MNTATSRHNYGPCTPLPSFLEEGARQSRAEGVQHSSASPHITKSRNKRTTRIALALALLLISLVQAHAQDTLRTRYGIVGGYMLNKHTADFRALPGVPNCCPRFESGSGDGFLAGALVEFPLSSYLLLSLRGSYVVHNARLAEREPVTVIVNGASRDGAFEHTVDATISSIGLEPSLGVRLFDDLFLNVGVRGGTYIAQRYTQEERIVDPSDAGTYLDENGNETHSRVRNASAGDLPHTESLLLQGVAGISYELALNSRRTLLLAPEVSYALSFTDVVKDLNWKANGLRAGLALKYSPAPTPPKPIRYDTLIVRDTTSQQTASVTAPRLTLLRRTSSSGELEGPDTIVVQTTVRESYLHETPMPPPMTCALTVSGVGDDGSQGPIATLKIEEFLSTIAHPILNYVFFDRNAPQLSARYTRLTPEQATGFRPEDLYNANTLNVYYTMLNIIGQRLRKYPNAVVTLTGCNMDQEEEQGNIELSRQRASAVRDYLMNVWGIDGSRLRTEAVNLPTKRSNPLTPDGQAENRRVEITASIPEILDVLVVDDTTRTSTPPIIRLAPVINSVQGVSAWEITVAQHGTPLKRFNGTGTPPASVDWDLANDQEHIPRFNEPLIITLNATNPAGENVTCRMELPTQVITVQQKRENRTGDFTIDRYNLILFNVGESGITPANQRVIDLVKSRLKPNSELTIEGFADRTGNAGPNQRLSANRARMTAEALGRPNATIRGIGEQRLLQTNDVPEGRFYCRTVQILVKTPTGR
jgi:outer membrane protein OmpA-like peptidoglycan-associated protein